MTKWLTGSTVRKMLGLAAASLDTGDFRNVSDDRKQILKLLEEAQGVLDTDYESGEEVHRKIRVCLKAQEE